MLRQARVQVLVRVLVQALPQQRDHLQFLQTIPVPQAAMVRMMD